MAAIRMFGQGQASGGGEGYQMFPSKAPSLQELEDRHLHLQDHIPSQQPGRAGVLRSEASAQRGLLQQSLPSSAWVWPGLSGCTGLGGSTS